MKIKNGMWVLEIITPPVLIKEIKSLDSIVEVLRESHAKGARSSKMAAFGVHMNPDLPSLSESCILNYLRAYVLLSDWLRSDINVDVTRSLLPYINEYPMVYKKKILKKTYCPSMNQLIDDYINYNRTRNRALDMLPLFAYIDKKRVRQKIDSELIKARPTLHYRLANTNLNNPSWNFTTEWKRWLHVEGLATNMKLQGTLAEQYLDLEKKSLIFNQRQWIQVIKKALSEL